VSGCPTLINCTIANNLSGVELPGVGLPGTRDGAVHNCIIYGNQGTQLYYPPAGRGLSVSVDYCLIPDWGSATRPPTMGGESTVWAADPCFVRWGYWEDAPATPAGRTRAVVRAAAAADTTKVLVEGDYHLQSQGWRWSEQPIHGSNWYFDISTSPAIDAGDPRDGLAEEPERAPDDPEGRWGFNHAIDLGAYGGTTQASLAPTQGEPPGVGAVDLQDYWPVNFTTRWTLLNPEGTDGWRGGDERPVLPPPDLQRSRLGAEHLLLLHRACFLYDPGLRLAISAAGGPSARAGRVPSVSRGRHHGPGSL
jgi:hypothetical protein